jgi:hypothetical protein
MKKTILLKWERSGYKIRQMWRLQNFPIWKIYGVAGGYQLTQADEPVRVFKFLKDAKKYAEDVIKQGVGQ